jgi:activator of HSP90 ATPase
MASKKKTKKKTAPKKAAKKKAKGRAGQKKGARVAAAKAPAKKKSAKASKGLGARAAKKKTGARPTASKRAAPAAATKKKAAPAAKQAPAAKKGGTTSIVQTVFIPASPEQVWDALMDPAVHSVFTGQGVTGRAEVGATMTAGDGYIRARNLDLERGRLIVQEWSTSEWPKGAGPSRLEIALRPAKGGTELTMTQTDVPSSQADSYRQGWIDYYWEPMQRYFRGEPLMVVAAPAGDDDDEPAADDDDDDDTDDDEVEAAEDDTGDDDDDDEDEDDED